MENTEFASQLAQYSSLEALHEINDSIQSSLLLNQSLNNSFMTSIIGKDVQVYGDGINFDGEATEVSFELARDANVTVDIFDQSGSLVRTIDAGSVRAGDRFVTWDGKDEHGNILEQGSYSFEVSATDGNDNKVAAYPITQGLVTGITYNGGSPYLVVNGQHVNLSDIVSINLPDGGNNEETGDSIDG